MKKNKISVVILVFNTEKNKLALQLRAAHDDSYPLHWDFSAAGGFEDNDRTPISAAMRELQEEIGISTELDYMPDTIYSDDLCEDQLFVFKTFSDGPFQLNPNEVKELKFFSLEEIEEMIKTKDPMHPELIFYMPYIRGAFSSMSK